MLRVLVALSVGLAVALTPVAAQAIPPVISDLGVAAHAFDMSRVTLDNGRWHENQNRTMSYLKFVDIDRLLYVYRSNHKLTTESAMPNGGWDAPR